VEQVERDTLIQRILLKKMTVEQQLTVLVVAEVESLFQ
jgi:hypothetical protein